jgi:hypothetical protein
MNAERGKSPSFADGWLLRSGSANEVPFAESSGSSVRIELSPFEAEEFGNIFVRLFWIEIGSLSEAASVGYAIAPTTKTNSRTIEPVRDDFYILGSVMLSPPILGYINP